MVKTQTLEQELLQASDTKPTKKTNTLAEHVSNELIVVMPRISPELFKSKRQAVISLTDEQSKDIEKYVRGQINCGLSKKVAITSKTVATIPRFIYVPITQQISTFTETGTVSGQINIQDVHTVGFGNDAGAYYRRGELIDKGGTSQMNWEAPFKLNVNAQRPKIPKHLRSLGDDAIGLYYDSVRTAPDRLRSETRLESPELGVIWSPEDSILYATGEIPEPEPVPAIYGPALTMTINGEDRKYQHIIALWDIEGERPLRNWLAEFSEGKSK